MDSVGGTLHHGSSSVATSLSSCSSSLGFGISTANGSEDHCNVALAQLFQQIMNDMKVGFCSTFLVLAVGKWTEPDGCPKRRTPSADDNETVRH